jgi:hypothetical protein
LEATIASYGVAYDNRASDSGHSRSRRFNSKLLAHHAAPTEHDERIGTIQNRGDNMDDTNLFHR